MMPTVTRIRERRLLLVCPDSAINQGQIMLNSIVAISFGASCGAVLRWFLGTWLNALFPTIPPGTLAANLIGGYLIGVALAVFAGLPGIAPEWRLLVITGFLGGLTTFSTFSAEVTTLLQQERVLWAGATIGLHVVGSVTMTVAGLATVAVLRKFG
jgi:CrcB protein